MDQSFREEDYRSRSISGLRRDVAFVAAEKTRGHVGQMNMTLEINEAILQLERRTPGRHAKVISGVFEWEVGAVLCCWSSRMKP